MLAPGRGDSQQRSRTARDPDRHSGAGSLLAAAGAIIEQVRGYIFVDAGLPIPGQTWMETVPPGLAAQLRQMADAQGWLPPWPQWWGDEALAELIPDPEVRRHSAAGCPRLPLAMFEEVHPPAPQRPDAPAAYLQLTQAYGDQAAKARELGWPVTQRVSHHLAPLTDPGLVTESLRELLGQLRQKPVAQPELEDMSAVASGITLTANHPPPALGLRR